MNNNTDGYSKLLVSCIFIVVLFLITGLLSLSANIQADVTNIIMVSGNFNINKFIPSNILNINNTLENIDIPDFLIEPEVESIINEDEVEAEAEIVYVGRIPYDYSIAVPESNPVDDDYFTDALFIGDSRTVGLFNYGGIKSYFYARVSLTIRGVLTNAFIVDDNYDDEVTLTVMETVAKYPQFKHVYFAFGINELGWNPDLFINTYEYVIDQFKQLLPDVNIYIQQIIPVTKSVSDKGLNSVRNETIHEFNDLLFKLAEKKQVFYLQVADLFESDDGTIPDDVAWDGIHLNIESCKKQIEYIRHHVVDFENVYLRPNEEPVTELVYLN